MVQPSQDEDVSFTHIYPQFVLTLTSFFLKLFLFLYSIQKHSNASQSLCEIIRLSRDQMFQVQGYSDPDPLLATLEKYFLFIIYFKSVFINVKLSIYFQSLESWKDGAFLVFQTLRSNLNLGILKSCNYRELLLSFYKICNKTTNILGNKHIVYKQENRYYRCYTNNVYSSVFCYVQITDICFYLFVHVNQYTSASVTVSEYSFYC